MSKLPNIARGYYPIRGEGITLDKTKSVVKKAFKKAVAWKDETLIIESPDLPESEELKRSRRRIPHPKVAHDRRLTGSQKKPKTTNRLRLLRSGS